MSVPKYNSISRSQLVDIVEERDSRIVELVGRVEEKNSRITELTGIVEERDSRITELAAMMKELVGGLKQKDVAIEDLQKNDNYHNGPNTPPSNDSMTRKEDRKTRAKNRKPSGRKTGGQPGHKGNYRKVTIDHEQDEALTHCTNCGSSRITETGVTYRTVTEIPPPQKSVTTKRKIREYECRKCGAKGVKKEVDIPKRGQFGHNVIEQIVENHLNRMPNVMNARSMLRFGIDISTGAVQDVIDRVSDGLHEPANEIKELVCSADILNVDETSLRYKGKNVWLWTFYDPITGRNYFLISETRGAKALQDVIGDGCSVTVVCDGWPSYRKYRIQRCVGHLIREAKNKFQKNPDSKPAESVLSGLRKIQHDAKNILDRPPDERGKYKKNLEARVRRLIRMHASDPTIGKFTKKLHRALPDMFRFVLDPRIPSTNNWAELSIRELIIQSYIRGCLRSYKAMQRKGDLFTCAITWKNLGMDYLAEISKYV